MGLLMTAAGAGINAVGAYQQGMAKSQADQYTAAVARNNQIIADWNARYATQRGQQMEAAKREQTAQMIGTERAMEGSRGLNANTGSAARMQVDTAKVGELDALTIRNNAARAAWGYRTQGIGYENQANQEMLASSEAVTAGKLNALSSIIGGASKFSQQWTQLAAAGAGG